MKSRFKLFAQITCAFLFVFAALLIPMKVQLRMEFINAFNHPLFPGAVVNPASGTFGTITASNQLNYARRAQLMAKFIF